MGGLSGSGERHHTCREAPDVPRGTFPPTMGERHPMSASSERPPMRRMGGPGGLGRIGREFAASFELAAGPG